ncbi:hypothetical protein JCM10207_008809 [Rhodosporidiobolus poonsookiae]
MATTPSAVATRLHKALATIHRTAPRLIASPPVVQSGVAAPAKRASVAIILRLRPDHPPPSSTVSTSTSPTTSPQVPTVPLQPSPPSSPSRPPSPSTHGRAPSSAASSGIADPPSVLSQLDAFFAQPWVNDPTTRVEILYIRRATRSTDRWSGHVAFPGGRSEPDDESAQFTAMRETWEEVGLDLAEKDWISIGQLDDREITTSLGKRLLMILSPFVFLHTSPYTPVPEVQEDEVASAHWIPLELLHPPTAKYGSVEIDIATRLAPRSRLARSFLQTLMGEMSFKCILLPNDPIATGQPLPPLAPGETLPDIKLWGLTLGMTLDLLSHMTLSSSSPDLATYPYPYGVTSSPASKSSPPPPSAIPSGEASIFPRFSHPDINLLIFLFSFRYRRLLRHPSRLRRASLDATTGAAPEGVDAQLRGPAYGRVNWAGMEAGLFYAAVRKALVVAVVLRAAAAVGAVTAAVLWVRSRLAARRGGMRVV